MGKHLTPFAVVERLIGRPEVTGRAIGVDQKSTYSWRRGSAIRDAGDIPSVRHMRALLEYSRKHDLGLTADHLIWGAPEDQIDAILAARGAAAA